MSVLYMYTILYSNTNTIFLKYHNFQLPLAKNKGSVGNIVTKLWLQSSNANFDARPILQLFVIALYATSHYQNGPAPKFTFEVILKII